MFFNKINQTVLAGVALIISFSASADDMKVMQAKMDMADALTKMGLLTNSFTEKGKAHADIFGMKMAQQLSVKLDELITSGLQHDAPCTQIIQYSDQRTESLFSPKKDEDDLGAAAQRSIEKSKLAIHNYVSARCEDLSE